VRGCPRSTRPRFALLSGLAEEALLRALLQPVIGLVPAALLFAVLHLVPDRRLWMWPVIALGLGLVLAWSSAAGATRPPRRALRDQRAGADAAAG